MSDREFDIVLFGATGFVGELTAGYLRGAAPEGTRIALGGRSEAKLQAVREELGVDWPLIVADSHDREALAAMAERARAVATTVGPYLAHGLPLVDACAQAGTHYADLTGEVLFMRRAIDSADDVARKSGARIVHTCGFDSVPSDIGVFLIADAAGDAALGRTTFVLKATRGGVSGGTIASMKGMVDEARRDRGARKTMLDLYALSPDRSAEPDLDERDPRGVSNDPALGGWLAPFVMGTVNSRVVRRSNALQGWSYGRGLTYQELMLTGGLPLGPVKAAAVVGGLAALVGGLTLGPTRALLDRVLPEPGEGPSPAAREQGFFKIDIVSVLSDGRRLICEIVAQGDPGYKATAVMLGESALALALDDDLPDAAGVLTPSTGMGHSLAKRLRAAGHTYEVTTA
ncbi:MAG: saccharopine dehydrogenase NADP-binding domain-containing protein [Actinomycetota bacterium]|nr:saccharopine dehydrogenase NADP-binding domain-containing protein [Actinomycetota bacterium]